MIGPVIDYPDRPAWPWGRIIGVPAAALLIWCALPAPLHDPLMPAPILPRSRPRLVTVEGYEWKNDRPDTSRVWTWTVPEDSVTVTATFAVVDDDTLAKTPLVYVTFPRTFVSEGDNNPY